MNKAQLTAALDSIGMRPGRGLGQNFLLDSNLLDAIVRLAAPQPGEVILEVGPGFGALTEKLLKTGAKVYSIEFDHRIADYLRKNLHHENFTLIEEDACRANLQAILPEGVPFRSIANLPYSISSIFLARLLELPQLPESMTFMLQREMAERLAAEPGCKAYGALSVRAQHAYDVKLDRIVPPEVFYPPPEVESAIAVFRRRDNAPDLQERKHLSGVVKTAFANRRKQMGKVLGANYGKELVYNAFAEMQLPLEIRPDRVTPEMFAELTGKLFQ
jgi:16S rRNA (adenine1518-N6/adenine1519-N6)-dimethyltransferase